MGKHGHEHNKQHRKKKDSREHKERSKKEHFLKKERKAEAQRISDLERTRYTLDPRAQEKLLTALRTLLAQHSTTLSELPAVFQMLDDGLEVDIVDIESGFVREKLEVVLTAMSSMIERAENEDGRFVYRKACAGSVKEQIENYLKAAQETPRAEWMTGMSAQLERELGPQPVPSVSTEPQQDTDLAAYMDAYNREHRPKTLMQMHREKMAGKEQAPEQRSAGYLYGEKTLQKRFAKGAFHSSFM